MNSVDSKLTSFFSFVTKEKENVQQNIYNRNTVQLKYQEDIWVCEKFFWGEKQQNLFFSTWTNENLKKWLWFFSPSTMAVNIQTTVLVILKWLEGNVTD